MWESHLQDLANQLSSTDYGCRESVAAHNKAADEIRETVRELGTSGAVDDLLPLLAKEPLRSWIAFAILEKCECTPRQRETCIEVIRDIATGSGVQAFGARAWLEENVGAS